jgi:hypothetical protein
LPFFLYVFAFSFNGVPRGDSPLADFFFRGLFAQARSPDAAQRNPGNVARMQR